MYPTTGLKIHKTLITKLKGKIDYLINIFLRTMMSFSPSAIIFFLTDLCCTHVATPVSGICTSPL